jgi:hypothetical protein
VVDVASIPVVPDAIAHGQALASPTLTQHHVLTVQSVTQSQTLTLPIFGGLVIGSIDGEISAQQLLAGELSMAGLMSGNVSAHAALSGTIH